MINPTKNLVEPESVKPGSAVRFACSFQGCRHGSWRHGWLPAEAGFGQPNCFMHGAKTPMYIVEVIEPA